MPVYALPPVHYGKSNEHIGFPGTLSVSATTFMAVVRDLGASLAKANFKKLVLYNTHGGNTSLVDVMARDLRAEFGLRTFTLHGSGGISFEGLDPQERAYGFHAGEVETSFLAGRHSGIGGPIRLHRRTTSRIFPNRRCCCRKTLRRRSHGSRATSRRAACWAILARLPPKKARAGWNRRPRAWPRPWKRWRGIRIAKAHERIGAGSIAATACAWSAACFAACATPSNSSPIITTRPRPGPHPTLLMRQPYGRDIASTVVYAHPVWFARRGYNVVIQDVRGRGDSGGEFYPFRHEALDGADTIAWLRARPESNGRVGMYGFSYQGITQLLAAAEHPEGLQCISPGMTACDLYHGWFYQSGSTAPGVVARLGNPDAEGGRAAQKIARGQRQARTGVGQSRVADQRAPVSRASRACTAKGFRSMSSIGSTTISLANIGLRSTSAGDWTRYPRACAAYFRMV